MADYHAPVADIRFALEAQAGLSGLAASWGGEAVDGGLVEALLVRAGYELTPVPDAHLCCGSAGTYSILQPVLAGQLKADKLKALESASPDEILTANIGCLTHLQSGTRKTVRHWIELLDERMR